MISCFVVTASCGGSRSRSVHKLVMMAKAMRPVVAPTRPPPATDATADCATGCYAGRGSWNPP